ncbi:acyltransferase family protein [Xanthobacter sp. V3C-3]|uniref:acyltransferase family protein n=1 Tax=Xanthobacter lutulentifluminis TaxID=3119935 RepID=UPI00372B7290
MSLAYRSDIDGLRAVAVGSVVLYHARFPPFSGGFIGVDVFFVISGFLITSIIYREISNGNFSLVDFYDRRIRRIFPALFTVIAVTTLLCALILMPRQMMEYVQMLPPAALFYANIYFQNLLNYFGPKAAEAPLLHLWSLAVEEQFYIFFPLVLFALMRLGGRKVALAGLTLIAIVSAVYAQSIVEVDRHAAFYLLTSRAWELLVGSLLALFAWPRIPQKVAGWVAAAGALAIVVPVFLYDHDTPFPGLTAAPPVLGAAAIIYAGSFAPSGIVSRILSLRPMVYVGRISYSLYLWHWPLLVLPTILRGRSLTHIQSGLLVVLAIALSALTLKYIETPMRRSDALGGRRMTRIAAGAGAILATILVAVGIERAGQGFFSISPVGAMAEAAADDKSTFQRDCNNEKKFWSEADMKPMTACGIGPGLAKGTYDVVMWGDSHAGATFLGIAEQVAAMGYTARLQTMAGCPPLIGGVARRDLVLSSFCTTFNASVIDEIRRVKPKVVILVGRWALWTTMAGAGFTLITDELPGGQELNPRNSSRVFVHMLDRTVTTLREIGSQVIVLGQSPQYPNPVPRCVARSEFFHSGSHETCVSRSLKDVLADVGYANDVIASTAARHKGVTAFNMSDVFCAGDTCKAADGLKFYYFDMDHLSSAGARFAGENPALRKAIADALAAGSRSESSALKP